MSSCLYEEQKDHFNISNGYYQSFCFGDTDLLNQFIFYRINHYFISYFRDQFRRSHGKANWKPSTCQQRVPKCMIFLTSANITHIFSKKTKIVCISTYMFQGYVHIKDKDPPPLMYYKFELEKGRFSSTCINVIYSCDISKLKCIVSKYTNYIFIIGITEARFSIHKLIAKCKNIKKMSSLKGPFNSRCVYDLP